MSTAFIPVGIALSIAIILSVYFYFNSKNRADIQKTIREALEKGVDLTPELIEKLSIVKSPKTADMRKGIILCFIATAGLIAGLIIGKIKVFAMFSIFPLMLGLGFLTVWKMNKYD